MKDDLPEPLKRLNEACTDWTIHNRDWPRHGFRYEVWAVCFFVAAKAVGRTLEEAIDRALKMLKTRQAKVRWGNPNEIMIEDDMYETHRDIENLL